MLRVMVLLLVLLSALPVSAQTAKANQKLAESSLQLNGSLVVDTEGHVRSHELDPSAPLTPALKEFLARVISSWRFQPVLADGQVVNAKTTMHLRLVASRTEDDKFSIRIASTQFGSEQPEKTSDGIHSLKLTPPKYPGAALYAEVNSAVYLVVQVGKDGKVLNADAEQVNLFSAGTDKQMQVLRKLFANAAIKAARQWTFAPPTTGEEAKKDSWLVRVPVEYRIGRERSEPRTSQWETYIPGPRNTRMPWAQEELKLVGSPDALPSDGVYPLKQSVQLLTPPAG